MASVLLVLLGSSADPALASIDILYPTNIAPGPDGNIYATAMGTMGNISSIDHVFVFSPEGGLVKTLDWQASNLAFDDTGNLYILERKVDRNQPYMFNITKLDQSGNVTVLWSNVDRRDMIVPDMAVRPDGVVYFSTVYTIRNLSAPAGDTTLDCWEIDAIEANGTLRTVRTVNTTPASQDGFDILAVDREGTIYTAGVSNRITVISPDGTSKILGKLGSANGTFNGINDIAIGRDGYLYVAELGNQRVQKLTTDGTYVAKWNGCGPDHFIRHFSLAIDDRGKVYVAELENNQIVWFTPDYSFGLNVAENMEGQGTTWGSAYAGMNYTTQQIMRQFEELESAGTATPTPGLSYLIAMAGFSLAGVIFYLHRGRRPPTRA
jgi:hypothetical protein